MKVEERFMRRALELAAHGMGNVSPNPMVGAVIVASDGMIIGEGYHRKYGEAHAEVNAVRSVKNPELLRDATMYVTLEPCSHYGKTPPCAKLIIDNAIRNVVVGAGDPNEKVCGRGITMMRDAGINVVTGVLADRSRSLNAAFMTAHTEHRPFVTLKWAQSADGWLDVKRSPDSKAAAISSDLGRLAVHRLRAIHDGILVGSGTVIADNPLLNTRLWGGRSPRPIILDRRRRIISGFRVLDGKPLIFNDYTGINELLDRLYTQGISSLLVEGGADVLRSFIESGLWDVARVETSQTCFGENGAVRAPQLPQLPGLRHEIGGNEVSVYVNNPLVLPMANCLIHQ